MTISAAGSLVFNQGVMLLLAMFRLRLPDCRYVTIPLGVGACFDRNREGASTGRSGTNRRLKFWLELPLRPTKKMLENEFDWRLRSPSALVGSLAFLHFISNRVDEPFGVVFAMLWGGGGNAQSPQYPGQTPRQNKKRNRVHRGKFHFYSLLDNSQFLFWSWRGF